VDNAEKVELTGIGIFSNNENGYFLPPSVDVGVSAGCNLEGPVSLVRGAGVWIQKLVRLLGISRPKLEGNSPKLCGGPGGCHLGW
jgi:hypothetical protein